MKLRDRFLNFLYRIGAMRGVAEYPNSMNLSGNQLSNNIGPTIASATQITITHGIHKISGSTSVTSVKIPTGFRGAFLLVATGAVPLTSGGTYVASDGVNEVIPFHLTGTMTSGRVVTCVVDGLLIYCSGVPSS